MSEIKPKHKLPSFAFLVCLAIATASWFIVTFSKDYKVTLDYKIQCYNLPEGKTSVTVSDSIISLTFNQKGLRYLKKPYSTKEKVVSISVADLVKPKNKVTVYSFSNREIGEFLSHHGFGSELVAVESPEVLTFYVR